MSFKASFKEEKDFRARNTHKSSKVGRYLLSKGATFAFAMECPSCTTYAAKPYAVLEASRNKDNFAGFPSFRTLLGNNMESNSDKSLANLQEPHHPNPCIEAEYNS